VEVLFDLSTGEMDLVTKLRHDLDQTWQVDEVLLRRVVGGTDREDVRHELWMPQYGSPDNDTTPGWFTQDLASIRPLFSFLSLSSEMRGGNIPVMAAEDDLGGAELPCKLCNVVCGALHTVLPD
jgi:hypothetical protein